jgi:hypothetical protein
VHISEVSFVAALIRLDRGENDYADHIVKMFSLMFLQGYADLISLVVYILLD